MSEADTIRLLCFTNNEVGLQDAVRVVAGERALVGFYYAAHATGFVRYEAGAVCSASGVLDLDTVYEARFFDAQGELRWLRIPQRDQSGRAGYLTESDGDIPGWDRKEVGKLKGMKDGQYILWGQTAEADDLDGAWTRLSTAAIGELIVPLTERAGGRRAALHYREYFGRATGEAGKDGNCAVLAERLTGLAMVGEGQ